MGYLEHTEDREPSEASLKATALMVEANTPYTEESDDGQCSECSNGTCPECVDRFISDFANCEGSAADWLRDHGCDVISDFDGDGTASEVMRQVASLSKRGMFLSYPTHFWRVMQKLSAQATKARAAA